MKLVINTETLTDRPNGGFSYAEAVRMIAEAGFDGIDCSFFDMKHPESVWNQDNWRTFSKELRQLGEDLGISFRQAHAPFPSAKGDETYDKQVFDKILRSMEASAILGVENIVVHPIHYGSYPHTRELQYQRSLDFYGRLIPYCEEFGIRVCTENMWSRDKVRTIRDSLLSRPEEFCALVDQLNSPWIGACLDVGHAALVGQDPADMVRRMGSRITCLHIHDVDYIDDRHMLPFTQSLDWESIAVALGQIGYQGDFTYEAEQFLHKMPAQLSTDGLKLMERIGRYLISRIEDNYPAT